MNKYLKYSLLFFLLVSLWSCNKQPIEQASVTFDRAFIPVFYYTYTHDQQQAERAMLLLDQRWKKLCKQFDQYSGNAQNWRESLIKIDAWLQQSREAIGCQNLPLALVQLDHARYEWIDLRWRKSVDYYLDALWELEATIDLLVQSSSTKSRNVSEREAFLLMVYDMEGAWKQLRDQSWNAIYFNINKNEAIARKQNLYQAIEEFIACAQYADYHEIHIKARAMECTYLNYLALFGDFESTETFFAIHQ